jgi:hypothetical protein
MTERYAIWVQQDLKEAVDVLERKKCAINLLQSGKRGHVSVTP